MNLFSHLGIIMAIPFDNDHTRDTYEPITWQQLTPPYCTMVLFDNAPNLYTIHLKKTISPPI